MKYIVGWNSSAILGRLVSLRAARATCWIGAHLPGLAAVPVAAFFRLAAGVLAQPLAVEGGGVGVHVQVIVVQSEQVAAGLDPRGGGGQGRVAAALGRRRQHVGMANVVASVDPAGQHHEGPLDLEIPPPMLGGAGRLLERKGHVGVLFPVRAEPRAGHHPREHEGLEIGRARQTLDRRILPALLGPRLPPALRPGHAAIGPGDLHVTAPAERIERTGPLRAVDVQRQAPHPPAGHLRQVRPGRVDRQAGIHVVPAHQQRRALLHRPAHGHRQVVVGKPRLALGQAGGGGQLDAQPVRHVHCAGLVLGHGQGVIQQANGRHSPGPVGL